MAEKRKERGYTYTFDQAVDLVLKLKDRFNIMPLPEQYERLEEAGEIDIDGLAKALGVAEDAKTYHIRPYAAVNIAVLRELRRRDKQPVYIAKYYNKDRAVIPKKSTTASIIEALI